MLLSIKTFSILRSFPLLLSKSAGPKIPNIVNQFADKKLEKGLLLANDVQILFNIPVDFALEVQIEPVLFFPIPVTKVVFPTCWPEIES